MHEVRLVIDHRNPDPRAMDAAAGALLRELSGAGAGVHRAPEPAPEGTKSGAAASLTDLVLTGGLSAAVVSAVASVVVGYIQRGAARSVTLKRGDRSLQITGASAEDIRRAVEKFLDDEDS